MANLYQQAGKLLTDKNAVALVEIIEHRGSTPRERGAQMLVWLTEGDGSGSDSGAAAASSPFSTAGTIGGGRLEADISAKAFECLSAGQKGALIPFELSGTDAAGTDMICGGDGMFMITVLTGQDKPAIDMASQAIRERRRAWLVTLMKDNVPVTAFVDDDRDPVSGTALSDGQIELITDSIGPAVHIYDDEKTTAYARVLSPGPLLYIFGGGHVGLQTALICWQIGFEITVIDDRAEYVGPERFPFARCITATSGADLPELTPDEHSYILIMTRGHLLDYDWLKWALSLPAMPKYVGMIGSRRKTGMIYDRLEREGVAKERIEQVFSPVGLPIGSQTPEEIAVSIAAQLIQVRNESAESR